MPSENDPPQSAGAAAGTGDEAQDGGDEAQGDGDGARRLAHSRVRMTGRDPGERGRVSTPLELLFDLTFVVAVGTAADQFAETLAAGHAGSAVAAFAVAMFAISVAWIGFTWFASAFGTDDWLDRALTMVQMIGVVVFSLGLPAMFHSVREGDHFEMRVIVLGYVVMRVALLSQWWRAARESPWHRDVGMANIRWTALLQLGWVTLAFTHLTFAATFAAFAVLGVLEMALPRLAQGGAGDTPWHPHHVAERYSLFAIIVLGEGVVGTVASSGELLGGADGTHWSGNAISVVVAGVGLTFGMWWVYFATPFGDVLERRRARGYLFGYGHIPLFAGIAASGGGLHVAGLALEHDAEIGRTAVVLALAVPVGVYLLMVYLLHTVLLSSADRFHLLLISATLLVLAVAVVLAAAGAAIAVCLLIVMLAPFVTVVGYETVGYRHQKAMLAVLPD
jgi:low temperature requirement protein LtrA